MFKEVDAVDDIAEVVEFFGFNDGFWAEIVGVEPFFVGLVEASDVGEWDFHFAGAAAFFDASPHAAHGASQIDDEVRRLKFAADAGVEIAVGFVVAFGESAAAVEAFDEDFGVFVDGAVEDDGLDAALGFEVEGEFAA